MQLQRQPLAVNNSLRSKRKASFKLSGRLYLPKQQKDDASIFNYARRGKQNSEGFGGGNRIGNRIGR